MSPLAQRSTAWPLALAYGCLLVYASLFPFTGWRWPVGQSGLDLWVLPYSKWVDRFDLWANVLGYLPLGGLVYAAGVRGRRSALASACVALVVVVLMPYLLELAQKALPGRDSSLRDWALNAVGGGVGVLLAWVVQRTGLFERWQRVRERWFTVDSHRANALLLLWPVALLFPLPVPFGVGQVFTPLHELLHELLAGTPWELMEIDFFHSTAPVDPRALPRWREALVVALGIMAPALVATSITRRGWRRGATVVGALLLGVAATTLSTALSFGPHNALAWVTPVTLPALLVGIGFVLAVASAGQRVLAILGLVVLTALVVLVAEAPPSAFYAANLTAWEQGRFIRFHGIAQWIGWLWPYAAGAWLMVRLLRKPPPGINGPITRPPAGDLAAAAGAHVPPAPMA